MSKERTYRQLGLLLRQARSSAKLTQEQASERASICSSYLSQLECGHHCPTIPVLSKLAATYGTTISALLEGVR
jgi:transcriptional regulator with XRE-family HTH domain